MGKGQERIKKINKTERKGKIIKRKSTQKEIKERKERENGERQ